ncbi:MAG: universal stress protein [Roseomonas sp.]|nr:universal stress protein [Roseomonas sp.]MCA3380495.1 universal stress protein [Roseomonas sp.]
MTFTSILTHLDPTKEADPEAATATPLALAEAFSAHVTALIFPMDSALAAPTPADDATGLLEDRAAATFAAAAQGRGVAHQARKRTSFAFGNGEAFADHLRVSDLAVLTGHGAPGMAAQILQQAAIFESGRPVLLVPRTQRLSALPQRILVAWDASPAAVRAIHGALPLIRSAAETIIATITDDKELRPGQSGIEVTHLLARHGAKTRFMALQRGTGGVLERLLAAVADTESDMLVMGAVRHSPLHNLVLGSVTQDVLGDGPKLPTLLAA